MKNKKLITKHNLTQVDVEMLEDYLEYGNCWSELEARFSFNALEELLDEWVMS
jgi:hypothetical protein